MSRTLPPGPGRAEVAARAAHGESEGGADPGCELCQTPGGHLLWHDSVLRVVLVDDPDYPGYLRVVWRRHQREMSDLQPAERAQLMAAVFAVEGALREVMAPAKINLASFGNRTPHLHWHVIARHADDPHFPEPVWGARQRGADPPALAARRGLQPALAAAVAAALVVPRA